MSPSSRRAAVLTARIGAAIAVRKLSHRLDDLGDVDPLPVELLRTRFRQVVATLQEHDALLGQARTEIISLRQRVSALEELAAGLQQKP